MDKQLVGRDKEQKLLRDYAKKQGSFFIAVVGRRRIGKTFLIRRTLEDRIDFDMTGIQNASKQEQLKNFVLSLAKYTEVSLITQAPKSWLEAFYLLRIYLQSKKGKTKKIVFLDELPWLASNKSGFLEALSHFWNDWASENNVLLITSGSAASWMLQNVVNNKGGLHNRIHHTIMLEPFTLAETKEMLALKKVKATPQQLIELYMIMGGVPYYLSLLERGKSIPQNIEDLLFEPLGKLKNEYENLLPSLFGKADNHIAVVEALATKRKGLSRSELADAYINKDGGSLSQVLEELVLSGFVQKYQPFQKSVKDTLYRLSDAYLLFYYYFLNKRNKDKSFLEIMKTQSYKVWCGYAFENVCLEHIPQIKKSLGISKISSTHASFFAKAMRSNEGMQIDLLIDRADGIINLCEMKFYTIPFAIDKAYYVQLKKRILDFEKISKTKKQIFLTMITFHGLDSNAYSEEIVDAEIEIQEFI